MRASSVRAEPRNLEPQLGLETQPRLDPTAERLVRKSAAAPGIHREYQGQAKRPAHPSNRLVTQLNERWSVADDPLQWILQRRKGSPRNKNSGWRGRSFCRTKDALLRCIREHCCSPDQGQLRSIREYNGVDKVALQQVRALPDHKLGRSWNGRSTQWRPRHLASAMLANSNPQELALLSIRLGALWEGSGS
jgi:hypothetical protein